MDFMRILYLHGLASSPASAKARFLSSELGKLGYEFSIPDLNLPTFESLSIRSILDCARRELESMPPDQTLVIGSSLGALTALHLENEIPDDAARPKGLVLLAPAFDFRHNKRLTAETVELWKKAGKIPVHHSALNREALLPYSFHQELESLPLLRAPKIPTLIIHGKNDEVIGVEHSRDFARLAPSVELFEVDSDHQLLSAFGPMLSRIQGFLNSAEISGTTRR